MFQRDPRAGVFLGGDRVSGQEIRDQNGQSNASLIHETLTKTSPCGMLQSRLLSPFQTS